MIPRGTHYQEKINLEIKILEEKIEELKQKNDIENFYLSVAFEDFPEKSKVSDWERKNPIPSPLYYR